MACSSRRSKRCAIVSLLRLIIRKMYFEGEREKRIKEPRSIIAVMIFSIIFMVTIGVYPDPIIQFSEFAAPAINVAFTP